MVDTEVPETTVVALSACSLVVGAKDAGVSGVRHAGHPARRDADARRVTVAIDRHAGGHVDVFPIRPGKGVSEVPIPPREMHVPVDGPAAELRCEEYRRDEPGRRVGRLGPVPAVRVPLTIGVEETRVWLAAEPRDLDVPVELAVPTPRGQTGRGDDRPAVVCSLAARGPGAQPLAPVARGRMN